LSKTPRKSKDVSPSDTGNRKSVTTKNIQAPKLNNLLNSFNRADSGLSKTPTNKNNYNNNNFSYHTNKSDDNITPKGNFVTNTSSNGFFHHKNNAQTTKNGTKISNKFAMAENNLNFSKIINLDPNDSDDLLIDNKEDHLLIEELNDRCNDSFNNKLPIFRKEIKLEIEEILDDRWTLFSK
jgi:hypothetical protein